jgi:hypothetical protein
MKLKVHVRNGSLTTKVITGVCMHWGVDIGLCGSVVCLLGAVLLKSEVEAIQVWRMFRGLLFVGLTGLSAKEMSLVQGWRDGRLEGSTIEWVAFVICPGNLRV